jgi:hypothetical protein
VLVAHVLLHLPASPVALVLLAEACAQASMRSSASAGLKP